jgi:hypothetical protein
VNVFFGPATGDEQGSSIEFYEISELDAQLAKLLKKAFVAGLIDAKPSRMVAFVSEAG